MKKPYSEICMTDHNHCKHKGAKVFYSGSQSLRLPPQVETGKYSNMHDEQVKGYWKLFFAKV